MKRATGISFFFLLLGMLLAPAVWAQTASVSGTVTDADDGLPLTGANVVIAGTTQGAATGIDGDYTIAGITPGSYTLLVRFVGYQDAEIPLTLAAGQSATVDVALQSDFLNLGAVVVSASRRAEKVLDAPASISVIDLKEIEQDVAPSASSMLRNTTGLDVSKTGVDRTEIVLRGFNNAFSGATYVLTDNREAAAPSLGVNVYSIMPALNIDLEQVEIVRGPGSALYGPGVDSGVIHFISKDPFDYPGTTASVSGGERSMFSGAFRHAGVVADNWGYKVTGNYAQANDWELDPDDPLDAAQLAADAIDRNYDYQKFNVNGLVKYRFNDRTSLTFNGGISQLTGIVLSGIGTLQADEFGYTYGQVRLQSGGFFAQAYFNQNDGGKSKVYGTGVPVVDNSNQINAQAQYNFDLDDGRYQLIVGADYELTTPDTDKTIYGRNEDNAAVTEIGSYAQATVALSPQFDLTVAGRGDYNDVVEEFQLSPRVAAVFKPTTGHTFRASYNRAFSSPGSNSLFLDIAARTVSFGEGIPFSLIFQGRGAVDGFTFDNFRNTNTALFSLPVPGVFGQPVPVNAIPLQPLYGVAVAQLAAVLLSNDPLPAPLTGLPAPQRAALAQALSGLVPFVQGSTTGLLGIPDDSDLGFRPVAGPVDIDPLGQTTSQVFEVGYKGIFVDRVLLAVDGYYANKKDFVGPLAFESPLVFLPNVTTDLAAALGPVIAGAAAQDPQVAGLLAALGLTPETAAGLVAGLAGPGLQENPAAVVQPDQQVLPDGTQNAVGGFLAYRNFGNIDYYGVDVSVQVLATDQLSVFSNVSWVSDDFFDNEELDETNTSLALALNAPTFKAKGGVNYSRPGSFSVNASVRYTDGFPVQSGPYVGEVDSYTLIDVGAGYDFARVAPGLRFDVLVQNVLDDQHREFIGAPKLGRMALARLVYTIR